MDKEIFQAAILIFIIVLGMIIFVFLEPWEDYRELIEAILSEVRGMKKDKAQEAYDEATASAQKAYGEAMASAWKAYDEAIAPASKAYDEAIAPAKKAYDEAIATAKKAYDKATATKSEV